MSHHSTVNSTGWFKSILQTNHLGAIVALVFSLALTACGGGGDNRKDIGPEPGPDGVAPTLEMVKIYNSFNSSNEVKLGQTVKLDFEASESLMKPTVTIGGMDAAVSGQHYAWSAELTMDDETVADGVLSFTISFADVSGMDGVDVTDVTEGDMVTYCKDGCPDPNEEEGGIAGDWKLAPEAAALGVGPGLGDTSWWSNGAGDLTARDCLFDDIYRFGADGSFTNVVGDTTWVEAWQGTDPEACGAPVAPHNGSNAATYVHDETASTITLDGLGAYLGLAKVYNGGELTNPADAKSSIVYTVSAMTETTMTLDVEVANGGHWRFRLVKIIPPSIAGDWKLAPEAGALGVGPGLGDTSWWSNGAGDLTARDCLFDDIYRFGADGSFTNVVGDTTWVEAWQGTDPEACGAPVAPHNGSNAATYVHDETASTITLDGLGAYLGLAKVYNGGELTNPADAKSSIVYTVSAATDNSLTLDVEVANGGHWRFKLVKIVPPAIAGDWKLAPQAGALGVGPGPGDTSWWSNGEGDLTARDCLFDDIYRFGEDGSFTNVVGDSTWVEAWQGTDPEACGAPVAPHNGSNAATFSYNEGSATITVNGNGAYLGLAKVHNGGELTNPANAKDSITYSVSAMTDDSMTLDIEVANGGYWRFMLVRVAEEEAPAIAGDWKLSAEAAALGVGPGLGDTSWWSNGTGDLTARDCLFDDIYRFGADGSFTNVVGDTTWVEAWQGTDPEACGAPVAPHNGSNAATYVHDETASTITLDGLGAYLGLAKVYNGGELTNPANAESSIVYIVSAMTDTAMTLDIEVANGGHWRFKLTKQ